MDAYPLWLSQARQRVAELLVQNSAMRSRSTLSFRAAAVRSKFFSQPQAISIGFNSGL